MSRTDPGAAALRRYFRGRVRNFRARLKRARSDPSEKNIHDLRTSIRRLEAAHLLLPREVRRQEALREYVSRVRELIHQYNLVRDADVIREKVTRHLNGAKAPRLMASLQADRTRGLRAARRTGAGLSTVPGPLLDRMGRVQGKLARRTRKVTMRHVRRVRRNLRLVSGDESRVAELHRLRIDSKMLRYVMEASGQGTAAPRVRRYLKGLQDILGDIHDCDVTLAYLRGHRRGKGLATLTVRVSAERDELFRRFAKGMARHPEIAELKRKWRAGP